MQDSGERLLRFHVLYSAVLKQAFDREEFVADDLYAFQALERALRSGNQELRNLAAHLQAQRQAAMESITIKPTEELERTRRMSSLPAEPITLMPVPPSGAPPEIERRAGAQRMSPQDMTRVTYMQRLYRQEFGRLLNFTRFTVDDSYGREVLQEALRANNQELAAMARFFIDEQGRPRQHRRASPAQAQAL